MRFDREAVLAVSIASAVALQTPAVREHGVREAIREIPHAAIKINLCPTYSSHLSILPNPRSRAHGRLVVGC